MAERTTTLEKQQKATQGPTPVQRIELAYKRWTGEQPANKRAIGTLVANARRFGAVAPGIARQEGGAGDAKLWDPERPLEPAIWVVAEDNAAKETTTDGYYPLAEWDETGSNAEGERLAITCTIEVRKKDDAQVRIKRVSALARLYENTEVAEYYPLTAVDAEVLSANLAQAANAQQAA